MPALFIYGSLKVPKTFKSVTGLHLKEYKEAWTDGKLVLYEDFPIAFPDDEGQIHGLLIELPYEIIQAIDTFEEEGRLLLRKEIIATTDIGEEEAFIYWGNPDHPAFYNLHSLEVIQEGIWKTADSFEYDM